MSFNSKEKNPERPSSDDSWFDDAAFEDFFKKYFLPVCAYCQYKFGFDLELAKEVVHTGFIKLWEVRHTLGKHLSPKAYLYRIITNSSLDILKHEKVKKQYVQMIQKTSTEEGPANCFESIDFKQLNADIDKAISELPEQMQRIFKLSRFEGLKYAEIASELNMSVKTVETQMGRALAKLREKLSVYLVLYFILIILSVFVKN
jgi:RNA polymerase sigma-70 factor (ECF subfamily)